MAEGPADHAGALTAASGAAVMLAMLAFVPVIQGALWWWWSLVLVAAALAVASGARRLGLPSAAAALAGATTVLPLATLLVVGADRVLRDGAGRSAALLLDVAGEGFRQIVVDSVPASGTPALALVTASGTALVALLVDAVVVGLRAPIAGMLVVLAVAIVPGKTFGTGTNGWVLVLVAAAALGVVAMDRRRRGAPPRVAGLAASGAIAVVLALVVQVVLPAPVASQAAGSASPLFGTGVDPLIRLGENLRRGATTPVLTYRTTGADQDVYLRLAVLEDFTGRAWQPNPADGRPLRLSPPPDPQGLSASAYRGTQRTTIVPASSTAVGERLPLPYPATGVAGADAGDFRWEERGLTLVREGGPEVGTYTVESAVVDAAPDVLRRAATEAPPGDRQTLVLPRGVPPVIGRTAAAWTAGARTDYDRALAIQNTLRGGQFAYDESTPAEQGYDGDGLGVIATFLRVKAGYCIHYASTMAVMSRLLGIPARIAVGYQPGEVQSGSTDRLVTSDDLHAWPELFFAGVGWVRFEPTPGRGAVPSYAPLPSASASAPAQDAAPSRAAPGRQPSEQAVAGARGGGGDGWAAAGALARIGGIALAVAALLAVPALVRVRIRRRRLAGAAGAWQELLDSLTDLGLSTGSGRSPRGVETVLARHIGPAPGPRSALARIRAAYERQAYSAAPVPIGPDDVRAVVDSAAERVSRRRRIVAAVAPRSLVGTLARSRLAFRWPPPGSD